MGAGVRCTPLQSRSTDRGAAADSVVPPLCRFTTFSPNTGETEVCTNYNLSSDIKILKSVNPAVVKTAGIFFGRVSSAGICVNYLFRLCGGFIGEIKR